jgi:hypothetical protein
VAAQAEDQRGHRHRHHRADHARQHHGHEWVNAEHDGEGEQHVGAEAHIGLLAHRHETGIAGQQVPQARQRHIGIDLGEQAKVLAVAP